MYRLSHESGCIDSDAFHGYCVKFLIENGDDIGYQQIFNKTIHRTHKEQQV